MKSVLVQKAVIVNQKNEVLLLRRSKTDVRRPLQWDLPGGLREGNEDLTASIKREIMEETSLRPSDVKPVYSVTEVREWDDEQGHHKDNVVFIFYSARTKKTAVKISYEHVEYAWLPIKEAIPQYKYYLHKKLLEYIAANKLL